MNGSRAKMLRKETVAAVGGKPTANQLRKVKKAWTDMSVVQRHDAVMDTRRMDSMVRNSV